MRILILASSSKGGAGIAAVRSAEALSSSGHNVTFLSNDLVLNFAGMRRQKLVVALTIFMRKFVTLLQRILIQKRTDLVTPISISSIKGLFLYRQLSFDIVHVHASYNFISMKELGALANGKTKIFVTLHDERFYTGGCHYSGDCFGFKNFCQQCPEMRFPFKNLASSSLLFSEKQLRTASNITFIAPSNWIASRGKASRLLANSVIEVVHNPVPEEFFHSVKLKKSKTPIVLGFIAQDLNNKLKGFDILIEALNFLDKQMQQRIVLYVASQKRKKNFNLQTKIEFFSPSKQDELVKFYRSLDFLIVPSLQDNSPNIILEAISSGVRVIGSSIGGIPELLTPFDLPTFEAGSAAGLADVLKFSVMNEKPQLDIYLAHRLFSYESYAKKLTKLYLRRYE